MACVCCFALLGRDDPYGLALSMVYLLLGWICAASVDSLRAREVFFDLNFAGIFVVGGAQQSRERRGWRTDVMG